MFLLVGLAAAGCGSLVLIARTLHKAPEAFEDENGFHLIRRRPNSAAVLRRRKFAYKGGAESLKEAGAHL
jgi:hypothetical protein